MGLVFKHHLSLGTNHLSCDIRAHQKTAVCNRRIRHNQLKRRGRDALAECMGRQIDCRPTLGFAHRSRHFSRHIDAGQLTEAEFFDVSGVTVLLELLRDFGKADVARHLENLRKRQPAIGMGVVDDFARIRVLAHFTIEQVVLADDPFLQRCCGKNGLEC